MYDKIYTEDRRPLSGKIRSVFASVVLCKKNIMHMSFPDAPTQKKEQLYKNHIRESSYSLA